MSAPPRTTLNFTALVPTGAEAADPVAAGAGLRFVCRLDARAQLPKKRRMTGARATGTSPSLIHERIRAAVVYARAEAAGARVPAGAFDRVLREPIEALADELLRLLLAVPLAASADVALPGFGLLLPAPPEGPKRPILPGFLRTLAIVGRRRGTLFLRAADPLVWNACAGEALDLWQPAPGGSAA